MKETLRHTHGGVRPGAGLVCFGLCWCTGATYTSCTLVASFALDATYTSCTLVASFALDATYTSCTLVASFALEQHIPVARW